MSDIVYGVTWGIIVGFFFVLISQMYPLMDTQAVPEWFLQRASTKLRELLMISFVDFFLFVYFQDAVSSSYF